MNEIIPNPQISTRTAILIDGGFFIKRYKNVFENGNTHKPETIVYNMYQMVKNHIQSDYLYRILYYDCEPANFQAKHPISEKIIDFSKSDTAKFKIELFEILKHTRKVALRFGTLKYSSDEWIVNPKTLKNILCGKLKIESINEKHVMPDIIQKGVDMKMGLDIASLAYKQLVNRIILISGDSDFVPAAKLARREGLDVILDPMWNHINPSLHEHIDGLISVCPNPLDNFKHRGAFKYK